MFPQENMRRLVPDERRIVHAFQFSKATTVGRYIFVKFRN